MTNTDDLPTWTRQSGDALPPLGESPAMAAARRSSQAQGDPSDPTGLADQMASPRKRRWKPPAFLAPLLVLAAGFCAGILLASEFIDVGGSPNEINEAIDQPGGGAPEGAVGDVGAAGDGATGASEEGAVETTDDAGLAVDGAGAEDASTDGDNGTDDATADTELQMAPLLMDDDDRNFVTADRYEVRYGGGLLYLTGTLPDEETANIIIERAGAIVGPDNIIAEHKFDPTVVIQPDIEIPIVVEDVVYFNTGSATIAPEFYPLIDLGVLLLQLNPQASITVLTYTDARGSEETNMELSRQRAQAIMDYLVFMGGNPDQLILDPRGEEGAVEGGSAEIAAEERRAEFILNGFLNGLFDDT